HNILTQENRIPNIQIDFIIEGINIILKNNYFCFFNCFYLQKRGTAMGTRFAPSYANLFMADWESTAIWALEKEKRHACMHMENEL
ncbi:Hypothetical predicted protein, partial [Pelobates cultripes]